MNTLLNDRIDELKATCGSQFRMALNWAMSELGEVDIIDASREKIVAQNTSGDEFLVEFELNNLPSDKWTISLKNEVVAETTDYAESCQYGENLSQKRIEEKEERTEASEALSNALVELMRNNGGANFLLDILASATKQELNGQGHQDSVIDPEKVYGKLWKKEYRPMIKSESGQSEQRQFSNQVLRYVQKYVLRGLHPESDTQPRIDGMLFAYSKGHGLYAPNQCVGIKLMKQPATGKVIPGMSEVLAMTKG